MLPQDAEGPEIGKLVVPIVPDEARTFGMESLFSDGGNLFERGAEVRAVDVNTLLYYKEAKDGQILEEGITEAGSMASFIAAGSAYATHGINTIPFFHLLLDVRVPADCRFHLARGGYAHARIFAGRHVGRTTLREKVCSIRTAIATCWRCRCRICWRTIPRLLMRSR